MKGVLLVVASVNTFQARWLATMLSAYLSEFAVEAWLFAAAIKEGGSTSRLGEAGTAIVLFGMCASSCLETFFLGWLLGTVGWAI